MTITSREAGGDDKIVKTDEETIVLPFSLCSFRLFESAASWDNSSFFIPLIQTRFSLLYPVANFANKKRKVSNQRKEEYNMRNHRRIYKVVKILYLSSKGEGSPNSVTILTLQFRTFRNCKPKNGTLLTRANFRQQNQEEG